MERERLEDDFGRGGVRRRPRKAWILGTVFAGLLGLSNAFGVAVLALNRRWLEAVTGLLSVLAAYWFAVLW